MSTRHLYFQWSKRGSPLPQSPGPTRFLSAIELYCPGLRSLWRGGKASRQGRGQAGRPPVTPDDEAALTSAERELERREAELIAAGPTTVEGTRAVAEIVGKEGLTAATDPKQIAQWLLGWPILNPPSTSAPDQA